MAFAVTTAILFVGCCLILSQWYFTQLSTGFYHPVGQSDVCEDYTSYSQRRHPPFSNGPLHLPSQRPPKHCRKFRSQVVDDFIVDLQSKIQDDDLGKLIENTLPNTLDTAILWFNNDTASPRTFISTGDIHAEWLRDSSRQLSVYMKFIDKDPNLSLMIKGAILQQAEFIQLAPYCNAFHAPEKSKVERKPSSIDDVFPIPDWDQVYECKWELDSLGSFLELSNEYIENSHDWSLVKDKVWLNAVETVLNVLERQSQPTFDSNGSLSPFTYTFKRETKIGTETLPLDGSGNPVNGGTGLIRSAFRPSDDSNIYQLFVPANAQMLCQLRKIGSSLPKEMGKRALVILNGIESGLQTHAIINHPIFGKVYAYEIDGFGGQNIMDDANIPSLLSLPDFGYGTIHDEIYQNTRKMVLSKKGNPYYLQGEHFSGVGGPHVGLKRAWPMSLLIQIRTSEDDDEIKELLKLLKTSTGGLGLMHEGINVDVINGDDYTRSWFSWCNSEFGKTILDLLERKPHLVI